MRVRRIDCKQLLGSLTLLILASSSSRAHAASFDCDSTSLSRTEKTICSSKELNAMDSDMDGIYGEMQNLARDPEALLRSQRDWITGRNRCDSTECLKRSYSARLAQLRATPRARWVNFADAGTGLRFRYLGNRSVKRCPDQPANPCFQLSGPKMAYGSDYLLQFEVTKGSLEAVANYNFEKQGDKWVAGGRGGSRSDVEVFASERWRGLVTSTICGVFTPQGFHGAAGDCHTYLMSNGERSVVMTTDGVSGNDAETLMTIRSVELEK